ncbi:GDSL-type esterase/lipase family protein [Kribbella sp. NPDC056345]|uniref:GDSL-type esterase/lipase family protein n=1 Tax=Kribbella sp. NPDC056345 TaxID=3345789 RepID=UPI0035DF9C70
MTESLWSGYQYEEIDADGWSTYWRLDPRGQNLALTDWLGDDSKPGHRLWERAATPAGVRGAWRTTAAAVRLEVRAAQGIYGRIAPLDILVNGSLHQRCELEEGANQLIVELPSAEGLRVEIWLPQAGQIGVRGLEFDGVAEAVALSGPRWITYGSSITQCSGAAGPSETWPALVARHHGWDLKCLGFSGECHLDPVVARTIRDTPARLISLCLGVNIQGGCTFSGRTLPGQVESFIATVRSGHPTTPIVVITPLPVPDRDTERNGVGLTLEDIRTCVELGARVDPAVQVIDGRTILTGNEPRDLYTDGLHPGPEGYHLIAERLIPLLGAAG